MDSPTSVTWDIGGACAGETEASKSLLELDCCRDPVSSSLVGEGGMRGDDGGVGPGGLGAWVGGTDEGLEFEPGFRLVYMSCMCLRCIVKNAMNLSLM